MALWMKCIRSLQGKLHVFYNVRPTEFILWRWKLSHFPRPKYKIVSNFAYELESGYNICSEINLLPVIYSTFTQLKVTKRHESTDNGYNIHTVHRATSLVNNTSNTRTQVTTSAILKVDFWYIWQCERAMVTAR